MLTIFQVKETLGDEVAKALCDNFPGEQLYIPKKQASLEFETNDDRNRYICNLFLNAGKSYDEIAAMVGLSKDRIMKIVSEMYKSKK